MRASYVLLAISVLWAGDEWPQFRGPSGQGHSNATNLPVEWTETSNVKWKVPVAGRGWSSPSIKDGKIWLTTATEKGYSLHVLSFDLKSGKQLKDIEVFRLEGEIPIHDKNSHASPTPILEGDRVYVHFGAHGTACLRTNGEVVWKTKLDYYHRHGPGGSPIIYKDLLIMSCDGYDQQFVVALDKKTGAVRWKTPRKGYQAYATPLVIQVNGQDQLISPGAHFAAAYKPLTGEEIWKVRYGKGYSNVPRPVFGHGLLFICTGFDQADLIAVKPDGAGDVTDTHIAWTNKRGIPLTPSPILIGDDLYFVADNGVATSVDAKTGKENWRHRLGGNFSASPLYADGKIFFLSEECQATVIEPGKEYKQIATSQMEGRCLASFATNGSAMFLRTDSHLYRLERISSKHAD